MKLTRGEGGSPGLGARGISIRHAQLMRVFAGRVGGKRMSCVMRVGGSFDVEALCRATSLPIIAKHRAGEPRRPGSAPSALSSVNVSVSDAAFDSLSNQVDDAMTFLEKRSEDVRRLVAFPGVRDVTLDFGVKRRDVAAQSDSFPARLVSLAGVLGVGITFSQYEITPG